MTQPQARRRNGLSQRAILAVGLGFVVLGVIEAVTHRGASTPQATVTHMTTSSGGVELRLACAGAACAGTVTLTAHERLSGGRVVAVSGAGATHSVAVGSGSFSLAENSTGAPGATLDATGRALRARFHHLPVTVTVRLTGRGHGALATLPATIR